MTKQQRKEYNKQYNSDNKDHYGWHIDESYGTQTNLNQFFN